MQMDKSHVSPKQITRRRYLTNPVSCADELSLLVAASVKYHCPESSV